MLCFSNPVTDWFSNVNIISVQIEVILEELVNYVTKLNIVENYFISQFNIKKLSVKDANNNVHGIS